MLTMADVWELHRSLGLPMHEVYGLGPSDPVRIDNMLLGAGFWKKKRGRQANPWRKRIAGQPVRQVGHFTNDGYDPL